MASAAAPLCRFIGRRRSRRVIRNAGIKQVGVLFDERAREEARGSVPTVYVCVRRQWDDGDGAHAFIPLTRPRCINPSPRVSDVSAIPAIPMDGRRSIRAPSSCLRSPSLLKGEREREEVFYSSGILSFVVRGL